MALKIAVYGITKNEKPLLERAIKSAEGADLILFGDTGSTDGTCDLDYVRSISVSPWRFDVARNTVLSLLPMDIDVCVALDSDEVLAEGWREEIEKHWVKGETTIMRYMYDWSKGVTFMQAKIHARSGYHWINPCHEFLEWYDYSKKENYAGTDKFLMYHHPDDTKSRSNYLPLLRTGYIERPHDHRMAFYYGRELYLASNIPGLKPDVKQAMRNISGKVLRKTIELKEHEKNRAEVSYCWRVIGQMEDNEEAYHKSIEELPTHREPYIWYADWLYYQKRFDEAISYVHKALDIKHRANDYTVEYRCWDGYPYHLESWCYWHLGRVESAIILQMNAIHLEPNNEEYKKALEHFQSVGKETLVEVAETETT